MLRANGDFETLSAYARQFLGGLKRPDVESITGLSPVVAIEQKTVSKNPRSTVGTVTELHDFLRLLYARAADAFSLETGEPMVRFTDAQIAENILARFEGQKLLLLSPMVRGRKGHYRELFEQIMRLGYLRARVDGELVELESGYKVDRYKVHDIEAVVDRIFVRPQDADRILKSVQTALSLGKGAMAVMAMDDDKPVTFLATSCVPPQDSPIRTRTQPVQLQQPLRCVPHLQRLGQSGSGRSQNLGARCNCEHQKRRHRPLGNSKTTSRPASWKPFWPPTTAIDDRRGQHSRRSHGPNPVRHRPRRQASRPRRGARRHRALRRTGGGHCPFRGKGQVHPAAPVGPVVHAQGHVPDMPRCKVESHQPSIPTRRPGHWGTRPHGPARTRAFLGRSGTPADGTPGDHCTCPLEGSSSTPGLSVGRGVGLPRRDRPTRSISGGEAQRIRLATQIGSRLTWCCTSWTSPALAFTSETTAS